MPSAVETDLRKKADLLARKRLCSGKSNAVFFRKRLESLLRVVTDGCDRQAIALERYTGLFQLDQLGAAVRSPIGAAMKHQKQAARSAEIRARPQIAMLIGKEKSGMYWPGSGPVE